MIETGRAGHVTTLDVDVVCALWVRPAAGSQAPHDQRHRRILDGHPDRMSSPSSGSSPQQNVSTVMGTARAGGVVGLAAARRDIDVPSTHPPG